VDLIPKREEFLRGQTPQTFRFEVLIEAHEQALLSNIHSASDDCQLVLRRNIPLFVVPGSEENIKITSQFDLLLSNCVISSFV
jgi:2-C-methyl-D-erythritol 4-phosphate cytidylyltransferase